MGPFSVLSKATQHTKSTYSSKSAKVIVDIDEPLVEPKFPIKQYEYIEGRNYRQTKKPSEQFLPCDDEEIERLQINHLLFNAGPGWWIMDMAKQYPKSHFTAVDAVIYPISQQDWEAVIPEIVRVTKPGGFIEFVELGGSIQDVGPNLSIWMMRLTVSLQTRNINLKIASQLESMIQSFDNVRHIESSHRSAPIGWYGRNGDIMLECIQRLFDSIKPKLCEDWSMNLAKYDKMVEAAAAECRDFKSWCNIHYTIAQKKKK
ncbi:hypothetical protein BCV71DRAFT_241028 [Rhizopus microsporus]|uniref:Methyltransferase type 11 domain-containing protein n=1 Tax=Rhizopus microsporus TaxID=58291 RepID=A0A1X0SDY5_RHIZD|nr:hypothetical protein BCV71DRAFT_241028 [Rhizopus microsporus]